MAAFMGLDHATFSVNGKIHKVDARKGLGVSLNSYLRNELHITGTKYMCTEGSCGACAVALTYSHPISKNETTIAVNSCLLPVLRCHGTEVTTIEGLGNKQNGYHHLIKRLAYFNGTQCGYCSPAMIMSAYSKLKKGDVTSAEIENALDGSICRCTGYRPILDAFKSASIDASEDLRRRCPDIEDLKVCTKGDNHCSGSCSIYGCPSQMPTFPNSVDLLAATWRPLRLSDGDSVAWIRPTDLQQLFCAFEEIEDLSYQLVAGNTSRGVLKNLAPKDVTIDVTGIPVLRDYKVVPEGIYIGANMTLSELMSISQEARLKFPSIFSYMSQIEIHLSWVANTPIRNTGTVAGNLMLKHFDKTFKSDIFLLLSAVGAKIVVATSATEEEYFELFEFMEVDMSKKIIKSIVLPPLTPEYVFQTYKVMPRSRSSYSFVHAAFLFQVDLSDKLLVKGKPRILFGGVGKEHVKAELAEEFLEGKHLWDIRIFQDALSLIESEFGPGIDALSVPTSFKFRKSLALNLFYKFVLSLGGDEIEDRLASGGKLLPDPVTKGFQEYELAPSLIKEKPLFKPVAKLEALIQASGEADYTGDKVPSPGQLYAYLVTTTVASGKIQSIDPSQALVYPGVVTFLSAKDIPGSNMYIMKSIFFPTIEEFLCSGDIKFYGQPLGIIVATSNEAATTAAKLVNIIYSDTRKPLLTVQDVLNSGKSNKVVLQHTYQPDPDYVCDEEDLIEVTGEWQSGEQAHYTMEPQTCLVEPTSNGLLIRSANQWPANTHEAVAAMLSVKQSTIVMENSRLGGGFGAKITKSSIYACACSLAAYKLNRPVRMVSDMETSMRVVGKRCGVLSKYKAKASKDGKIKLLIADIYIDKGWSHNDPAWALAFHSISETYHSECWKVNIYDVLTDKVCSSWMRAPGTLEGFSTLENIMEHVAQKISLDPYEVRQINLKDHIAGQMLQDMREKTSFDDRLKDILQYNKDNRWTKRGISLLPMIYPMWFFGNHYCNISIYIDGSVILSHGGVEIGQGINTKVAQVCSSILGVSLDQIKVIHNSTFTSPNNSFTGASITTAGCAQAAKKCCEQILKNLEPARSAVGENSDWVSLVKKAHELGLSLHTSAMWSSVTDPTPKDYPVHGVAVTEVIVDTLTGQHKVLRADIELDAGESLNPDLDVGQVEGGFVMGLGNMTCEKIIHDPTTGAILTDRAWYYFPPSVKDIPLDFRVYLKKNSSNPLGVYRSKATGEPPLCLALSVVFALKMAVAAARLENNINDEWFKFCPPCTVEEILMSIGSTQEDLILNESTKL